MLPEDESVFLALDAYAAAVERETEARVRAEIAERLGYTLADMRRKYHHLISVARDTADASHVVAWVSGWIRGVEQINGGDE